MSRVIVTLRTSPASARPSFTDCPAGAGSQTCRFAGVAARATVTSTATVSVPAAARIGERVTLTAIAAGSGLVVQTQAAFSVVSIVKVVGPPGVPGLTAPWLPLGRLGTGPADDIGSLFPAVTPTAAGRKGRGAAAMDGAEATALADPLARLLPGQLFGATALCAALCVAFASHVRRKLRTSEAAWLARLSRSSGSARPHGGGLPAALLATRAVTRRMSRWLASAARRAAATAAAARSEEL